MAHADSNRDLGNLGAEVTSFVGRRREAADVGLLLSSSRLVTLTGVGGVGKTRLACRVGAARRRDFADGVWFVDLAPLTDPALLTQTVASALDLPDQGAAWPVAALARSLSDRSLLLILDNCEHLRDGCAVLVDSLLRTAPDLRVIVTSRQSLGLASEFVYPVPPLSTPGADAATSMASIARYEAVNLFVERAHAVRPTFELTEQNLATVVAVCQQLDGIPLALELAAARVSTLSVQDLLKRLEDRFGLLTGGSTAAAPRHRTLTELIAWSWGLCSAEEQLLWARASVFSGGFDLRAAEAVCSDDDLGGDAVVDALTGLVEKTIVTAQEHAGGLRYRLLETLRQFGRVQFSASEQTEATRDRHRAYYGRLASIARDNWFGERQKIWLDWFRTEHGNIRSALEASFDQPAHADHGLRMVADLWVLWFAAGRTSEARHWLDSGLMSPSVSLPMRRGALARNAYLSVIQQDLGRATRMVEELETLPAVDDETRDPEWSTEYVSALVAMSVGDLERAELFFETALTLAGRSASLQWRQDLAFCRALVKALLGDVAGSEGICRESIETSDLHGETSIKSYMLWCWGLADLQAGHHEQAASRAVEALAIALPMEEEPFVIALCFELLAWVGATTGRPRLSARLIGAAESIWSDSGWFLRSVRQLAQHHDDCRATLRDQLGEELGTALAAGASASWESLAAQARDTSTHEPRNGPARPSHLGNLTKRESEVAELVAQGLTNRAIATRLVISPRTAEAHLERILAKLGFHSRTQVAAWVVSERTDRS